MREDIYETIDTGNGRMERVLDATKVFGKGYGSGLFVNNHSRYRCFKGARNTKKSKNIIGYEPIFKILENENRNILMLRQNDIDNRQTTWENLRGCIYDLGLQDFFIATKNPLCITYIPTQQQIIFRGMNNPTSLNSLTFAHGFLTDIYIEEAYELESYEDFRKIDGSLRGKLPDGLFQQITMCFNAWNEGHWIYEKFFKMQTGKEENIYITDTLRKVVKQVGGTGNTAGSSSTDSTAGANEKVFYEVINPEDPDAFSDGKGGKYGSIKVCAKSDDNFYDNTFVRVDDNVLAAGLESGKYHKCVVKIIYGLEDDYDTLNREDVTHIMYNNPNWIGDYGKGLFLHTSTWKINEFRDKENYDLAMYNNRDLYLEKYKVEALGMWGVSSGVTYPCWNAEKCIIDVEEARSMTYMNFAIGIDTGYSNGEGKKRTVAKNEDPMTRVRSATVMTLGAITKLGYNANGTIRENKWVILEEYFHSNDKAYNELNTDSNVEFKDPVELVDTLVSYIERWLNKWESVVYHNGQLVYILVDNADVGTRKILEMALNRNGLGRFCRVLPSDKTLSIQARVDFTNELMAFGNFKIVGSSCPNLIREIKNARRGKKGEAREDTDDHCLNSAEYNLAYLKNDLENWKQFKVH